MGTGSLKMTHDPNRSHLIRWIDPGTAALRDGEDLTCVRDGPVVHVVLNRPAKHNAINAAMWERIGPLTAELDADPSVRLVVFRGAGDAAFSAGADISEFREIYADPERTRRQNAVIRGAQLAVEGMAKPTLAVIQGACVGGGCGLALACDLRFAATRARFGITPSKLGLVYSLPDSRRLVALVGPSRAKDMLFSGRLLDADEALAIGLVDRVWDEGTLETSGADYARALLANSSGSIAAAKEMINSLSGVLPQSDERLEARFAASFSSADFAEGNAAFTHKRTPKFN